MIVPIALGFVILHNLSGQEVALNAEQIISVSRSQDGEGKKLLTDKVACIVGLSNGKFVTVIETCDAVLREIEAVGGKVGQ